MKLKLLLKPHLTFFWVLVPEPVVRGSVTRLFQLFTYIFALIYCRHFFMKESTRESCVRAHLIIGKTFSVNLINKISKELVIRGKVVRSAVRNAISSHFSYAGKTLRCEPYNKCVGPRAYRRTE